LDMTWTCFFGKGVGFLLEVAVFRFSSVNCSLVALYTCFVSFQPNLGAPDCWTQPSTGSCRFLVHVGYLKITNFCWYTLISSGIVWIILEFGRLMGFNITIILYYIIF
jgi:hypothetical protein